MKLFRLFFPRLFLTLSAIFDETFPIAIFDETFSP